MINIGSRGSTLALVQTNWVKDRIRLYFPEETVEVRIIRTSADRDITSSIRSASAIGVFVKEIEEALLSGEIDLAVHSMKDVPTRIPEGLEIGAVPEREDPRDALITRGQALSLADLTPGSTIGTGSVRRQAQILAQRPDLRTLDIRGNVDTRLQKLAGGSYDAIVLACAGLNRLDMEGRITSRLSLTQMLPAPGQGALALEIRKDDRELKRRIAPLNHAPSALAVRAERAFLRRMGGGCNVPVAVHAGVAKDEIKIDGLAASPDGSRIIRDFACVPADSAEEAADELAAKILSRGGKEILDSLR